MDFDRPLWNAIRDEARRGVRKELPAPIVGCDVHPGAIDLARTNAAGAGVGHLVEFDRRDVRDCRPPEGPARSGDLQPALRRAHRRREGVDCRCTQQLGETIGKHWPGWRLFVFTSNDRLARKVGLPVRGRTPFFNGKLACQLWEFGAK